LGEASVLSEKVNVSASANKAFIGLVIKVGQVVWDIFF